MGARWLSKMDVLLVNNILYFKEVRKFSTSQQNNVYLPVFSYTYLLSNTILWPWPKTNIYYFWIQCVLNFRFLLFFLFQKLHQWKQSQSPNCKKTKQKWDMEVEFFVHTYLLLGCTNVCKVIYWSIT